MLDTFDSLHALRWVVVVAYGHGGKPSRVHAKPVTCRAVDSFPFSVRQRVRFGETDTQQVVYYANYLLYAEVGRMEYLRHLGVEYGDLMARGMEFTIGEAHVRYRAPLRFDDLFDIKLRVGEIRGSSWEFEYAIDRADGLHCADVKTIQVVIGRESKRAERMPDELRRILERAKGE